MKALCGGSPELFFSEIARDVAAAQAICATCPLRASCLADALERAEPWGVWGGVLFVNGAPGRPSPAAGRNTARRGPAGVVSLWCANNHRRSVANTRTEADGRIRCLECSRKRSRKSRARKAAGDQSHLELVA